jgi:hypothetical protein
MEFKVCTSWRSKLGNDQVNYASLSEYGVPPFMTFGEWASLNGRLYLVQIGTEDAPVASTTSIDDQLVWALVDVPTGVKIRPVGAEVHIVDYGTGTISNVLVEIDRAKVRYSSGGSAFTALNMNTGFPNASRCNCYVGTDVTVGAKTTNGSMEVNRYVFSYDALETMIGSEKQNYPWEPKYPPTIVGPGSFLLHFGCATADMSGYGNMLFIELD